MAKRTVRGNKETDGGLGEPDATKAGDGNGGIEELFPGVPGADPDVADPAEVVGSDDPAGDRPRKRRGRGPGRAKRSVADEEKSANNLARLLYGIHAGIAKLADMPELELTDGEADNLGEAVHGVAKLYKPTWLTEEAEAWANLVIVAGAVYGPRIIAARMRKNREKDGPRVVAIQ